MRKGNTRRYRTEKLVGIEEKLRQAKREGEFESQAYGEHDPFDVELNPCERCGGDGQIQRNQVPKGARFLVICQLCGHQPSREPAKRPWLAALDWNAKSLGTAPHYTELPLFGLQGLGIVEARARLVAVRENLELRRKSVGLRRSLRQEKKEGSAPPGRQHQQKLDAYLKWAMYGLRLVKYHAERASGAPERETGAP